MTKLPLLILAFACNLCGFRRHRRFRGVSTSLALAKNFCFICQARSQAGRREAYRQFP